MNKYIVYILLCAALFTSVESQAKFPFFWKKKSDSSAKADTVKKVSDYDKLFKDKQNVKTVKGLMTLHIVDGQLLVELPLSLLGRDMMLFSAVSEISDHTDSYVGGAPIKPQPVTFSKIGKSIQLRRDRTLSVVEDGQKNIENALAQSNLFSILNSYDIKAYTADSSAVVFDMTSYFTGDESLLSPIDARGESKLMLMGVNFRASKDRSFLDDVKAYDDNVSIYTYNTYDASFKDFFNKVTTARMTRTFVLLPEVPMKTRLADYRIPVTVMDKYSYQQGYKPLDVAYFVTRWRLEPKDAKAYDRGELTEPIKPIVFYIDTTFTDLVREGVTEGILQWNRAFESIGFKDAIRVLPYPSPAQDPMFDPENFRYSCIRYVPSLAGNTSVKTYADHRTGEILRTTMHICHNYTYELGIEVKTFLAHADPAYRKRFIDDKDMKQHIVSDMAWFAGVNCFGMSYNLTGSAAFSTDSLRSASFTQKYGTTPSILDLAKFNFVAPVDAAKKGIRLTPIGVGEYDCHVVKCLYKPIPGDLSAREELNVISGWIDQHVGDPLYRYENAKDCPDCGANDVGDDDIKNFKYSVENLKYSMANFDQWATDEQDPTYLMRKTLYQTIHRRYKQALTQVSITAYGIKTFEKKSTDKLPSYIYTPREKQLEALEVLYSQMYQPEWTQRESFERLVDVGADRHESHKDYMFLLMSSTAGRLFMYENVKGSMGHKEYIEYMYNKIFDKTRRNAKLIDEDFYYQMHFFKSMVSSAKLVDKKSKYDEANKATAATDTDEFTGENIFDFGDPSACVDAMEKSGVMSYPDMNINTDAVGAQYGDLKKWPTINSQVTRYVYYLILKDMQKIIAPHVNDADQRTRLHYRYIADKLNRLLN